MNYEILALFWGCMKYEHTMFLNPILGGGHTAMEVEAQLYSDNSIIGK